MDSKEVGKAQPSVQDWREAIEYYAQNFELGLADEAINIIENRAQWLSRKYEAKPVKKEFWLHFSSVCGGCISGTADAAKRVLENHGGHVVHVVENP